MARKGYSYEIKIEAVKSLTEGRISINALAKQLGTNTSRIHEWLSKYRTMGATGLEYSPTNQHYPNELKNAAVNDYLAGTSTLLGICEKYKIRSMSQLRSWIKKYNDNKELKATGTGESIEMNVRKTTFDERVEIVKACIEQGHNYNLIAQTYQASYQQVRSWTKKYEQYGLEGLHDRRGRRKSKTST